MTSPPEEIKSEPLDQFVRDAYSEAYRCADAHCWRAALVMIGSTLEATLLLTVLTLGPALQDAGLLKPGQDARSWSLGGLAKLAKQAGWITPDDSRRYDLTTAIELVARYTSCSTSWPRSSTRASAELLRPCRDADGV